MRAVVRFTRQAFEDIVLDLCRAHPFAVERVGFMYARYSLMGPDVALVFPVAYRAVLDEHYIEDDRVGACIGTEAIRSAHQHALSTGLGCLHVHMHGGSTRPWVSGVDLDTLRGLAPSLRRMARGAPHGGVVLSRTSASALLWLPSRDDAVEADVSIVGYPMLVERSCRRG